jgi:hypothetical protein
VSRTFLMGGNAVLKRSRYRDADHAEHENAAHESYDALLHARPAACPWRQLARL